MLTVVPVQVSAACAAAAKAHIEKLIADKSLNMTHLQVRIQATTACPRHIDRAGEVKTSELMTSELMTGETMTREP
jgi:hypothetical protein